MQNNLTALKKALDDEYKAHATYRKVIDDFGEIRPFINIVESEQRHINALLPFFQKYGAEIPTNPHLGKIKGYSSVKEACRAAAEAEIENEKLYTEIIEDADDPSLITVFKRLQDASQNRHLPAFQRCLNKRS